jgi:hypothetical protein
VRRTGKDGGERERQSGSFYRAAPTAGGTIFCHCHLLLIRERFRARNLAKSSRRRQGAAQRFRRAGDLPK